MKVMVKTCPILLYTIFNISVITQHEIGISLKIENKWLDTHHVFKHIVQNFNSQYNIIFIFFIHWALILKKKKYLYLIHLLLQW